MWQLSAAEGFERYAHTKYVSQKWLSLEDGDTLIALRDDLVQRCGAASIEDIVIAMARRERLIVLLNVLGKAPSTPFFEFEGHVDFAAVKDPDDAKYHKSFSADLRQRQCACGACLQSVASRNRGRGC